MEERRGPDGEPDPIPFTAAEKFNRHEAQVDAGLLQFRLLGEQERLVSQLGGQVLDAHPRRPDIETFPERLRRSQVVWLRGLLGLACEA